MSIFGMFWSYWQSNEKPNVMGKGLFWVESGVLSEGHVFNKRTGSYSA